MDHCPCYVSRVSVIPNQINTPLKAKQFLAGRMNTFRNRKGMLMFSITENEFGNKKEDMVHFLEAAMKYKNAGYTSCKSQEGNYRCYLVLIPLPKE